MKMCRQTPGANPRRTTRKMTCASQSLFRPKKPYLRKAETLIKYKNDISMCKEVTRNGVCVGPAGGLPLHRLSRLPPTPRVLLSPP